MYVLYFNLLFHHQSFISNERSPERHIKLFNYHIYVIQYHVKTLNCVRMNISGLLNS